MVHQSRGAARGGLGHRIHVGHAEERAPAGPKRCARAIGRTLSRLEAVWKRGPVGQPFAVSDALHLLSYEANARRTVETREAAALAAIHCGATEEGA